MTNKIQTLLDTYVKLINRESAKLLELVAEELMSLSDESVKITRDIFDKKKEWKEVAEEVKKLESKKDRLKQIETEANEKMNSATSRAAESLTLHKVLTNREKVLDARETELKIKERRKRNE